MSFSNCVNPIIEVFLIRNDQHYKFPDIELLKQDPMFFDLPENNRSEINSLSEALCNQKNMHDALQSMPFQADYNTTIITILHNRSDKGSLSDIDTLAFIFQCLSWISLESQTQTADMMITLLEIFKSTRNTNLNRNANAVFAEFVAMACEIQKEAIFEILIDPILDNIKINQSLDETFYFTFIKFITKIQKLPNKTIYSTIVPIISKLMEQNSNIFINVTSLKELAYLVSGYTIDLNLDTLYILCRCSNNPNDDSYISDLFLSIPHLIFSKIQEHPVVTDSASFTTLSSLTDFHKEINNECVENDSPDSFIMPGPEIIENKVDLMSLCNEWMQQFIPPFLPMIEISGKACIESIVTTLGTMKDLISKSKYVIDFTVVIILILQRIAKRSELSKVVSLIMNQFTFYEEITIFNIDGLTDAQNRLRNDIFELLVKYDRMSLKDFFISSSSRPMLYAENLMRASYICPLNNDFYSSPNILPSLVGASLLVQQYNFPSYIIKKNLAKSIIFHVLFGLFDEPETALHCFESHIFSAGFLSLIFDSNFSNLIMQSLSDCLSKFPVLPEPVSLFVVSLFKMCSLHHEDQHLSSIAKNLAHAIIRSISHNISIGSSFESVFDSALEFLQIDPTEEMLDSVLSMLQLITQGSKSLLVDTKRFNNLLNLVHSVEKDEPSDSTMLKMQNLLNTSTNLAMGMMFLIKTPDVLPLLLIAFAKSKRLSLILTLFMNLCKFSTANIHACHDGDIDLILLQSISGPFEYKKRQVEFELPPKIIETHVMKLVAQIVSVRSSYAVDKIFLNLFTPINGQFGKHANLSLSTLDLIFSSIVSLPSPTFPISSDIPLITYEGLKNEQLKDGFVFAFYAFIDVGKCLTLPYTYYFIKIFDDKNNSFTIFYQQKGLYARLEGNGLRTSAPLTKDLTSNEWILCLIIYEKEKHDFVITLKVGKENKDEIDFREMSFNENIHTQFCFSDGNIPSDEPTPVTMGPFCLFPNMKNLKEFESIRLQGFAALQNIETPIAFTNNSKDIILNREIERTKCSIKDTLFSRLKIEDFIPIFASLKNAPKLFAELVISVMKNSTDFSLVTYTDIPLANDETEYLTDLTGIKFTEPIPDFQCEHQKLSALSVMCYLILTNSRELITFQLLTALSSLFDNMTNLPVSHELINLVVLNPFYWCSATHNQLKRIFKYWNSLITRGAQQITSKLFENFLIKTHLLANFSENEEIKRSFSDFRFKTLETFALTKSNENIISLTIAMIFSIVEENQNEAIQYIKFLSLISEATRGLFDDDSIMVLLPLADLGNVDFFYALLNLYDKASGIKNVQRITQLSLRFFSKYVCETSHLSLDVQCIRAIKRSDNIEELEKTLEKEELSVLTYMWYFWPIIVGFVHVQLRSLVVKYLVKNTKDFEKIISLFRLLKSYEIFKVKEFRNQYIEEVVRSENYNASLITPMFVAHFYRFSSKQFTNDILNLMAQNKEVADVSHADKKEFKGSYPTGTFDPNELIKTLSTHLPINQKFIYRPNKSLCLLECVKSLIGRLSPPLNETLSIISTFIYTPKESAEYPMVMLSTFSYFEKNVCNQAYQNILQSSHIVKSLLIGVNPDAAPIIKNYELRVSIQRMHFNEFVTFSKIKSGIFISNQNGNFLTSSYQLGCPFRDIISKLRFTSYPAASSCSSPSLTLWPNLSQLDQDQQKMEFVCSFPSKLIKVNKICEVIFNVFTDRFTIEFLNIKPIVIFFDSISFVFPGSTYQVEIYTLSLQSYLLELSSDNKKKMLDLFSKLNLSVLDKVTELIDYIIIYWENGKMSSFDFLISFNILYGRSFNDANIYPFLPNISFDMKPFDLRAYSQVVKTGQKCNMMSCLMPEMYFEFGMKNVDVYQNRKNLEKIDYRKLLSQWVKIRFNKSINYVLNISIVNDDRKVYTSNTLLSSFPSKFEKLIFFGDFSNYILQPDEGNGVISISSIDWKSLKITKIKNLDNKYQISELALYSSNHNFVVLYDKVNNFMLKINKHLQICTFSCPAMINALTLMNSSVICVVDHHSLEMCPVSTFPKKLVSFFNHQEKVIKFELNETNGVIVLLTKSGFLLTVSIENGMKIGEYDLGGRAPNHFFITESLSFVIVEIDLSILVFTSDLTLIKTVAIYKPIIKYVSYTMQDGLDYVAFVDSDCSFQVFEAYYPEKIDFILNTNCEIIEMKHILYENLIALISKDGKLFTYNIPKMIFNPISVSP